ncbi:uncharacterized protein LOC112053250 isoform X1 [Bicyclus anynana]|uniref:Uncharacterized protein LOC112053250 isoform X1 n=1 Tax=Bicyclus anynana TaxID=110368 RepID=A0ABM3LEY1_BICAN|nr:uncharacterized protein LOC112053250 [Bicyclus anynana]
MPRISLMKCYFGCTVDGPLHRFPKWQFQHEEKFNSWKAVLSSTTQEYGNEYIYNNVRLCYRHFEKYFQLPSHRLTGNAVPTLYLTAEGLQAQALGSVVATSTSTPHSSLMEPQQVVLNNPAEEQVTLTTATTLPATNFDFLLNVSNKVPKYRGVHGASLVTSHKSRGLVKKIDSLKETITKLRKKCETQTQMIRMAGRISKSKAFLEVIEQFPEPMKIFMTMQLKHGKRPRGRKYSLKEKILCLTILKQSPKGYNLLKKLFVLPSKRTLQKLLSYVVMKPGINLHIIENLKKAVRKLPMEKRLCSLIFDEVALSPGLYYNTSCKEIIGFEDFGYKKTKKIADHALVIMIKSIKGKFKQPISFTFCQSATKKDDLKILIKESIRAISSTGLKIICTVCDQSTTNMSTIKSLHEDTVQEYVKKGEEFKSDSFEVDGIKIFPLFDPPHLLKGIRNNLLLKNLRFIENGIVKVGKWEHLLMFMEKDDEEDELRLVNKLTDSHVIKEKIPKMKVKYAAQVFSQRLSNAIKFCTKHGILPKECEDTADLLRIMDQLFDSFNGHNYKDSSKKFRCCLKNGSPHFKLWEQVLPVLRSMGYEKKKRNGTTVYEKVPSIKNFIHNIRIYREMWTFLQNNFNVTSLLPRNLNQDPLENFFCKIRSNGVRNTNPTCDQFINSYKTLIINSFGTPHSVNANCEDDNNVLFKSMENFLQKETCADKNESRKNVQSINLLLEELETPIQPSQETGKNFINKETKKYVAGWILKKARIVFKKCPVCTESLISKKKQDASYIYERDYTKKSLHYPSNEFSILMKDVFHSIARCMQESPESRLLANEIKFHIEMYCDFNIVLKCPTHFSKLKEFIIALSIKLIVNSWCMGVNKILKGKMAKFNENDFIKTHAYQYYKIHSKYKSK